VDETVERTKTMTMYNKCIYHTNLPWSVY